MNIKNRFKEISARIGPLKKELLFTLNRVKKSPLSIVGICIIILFSLIALLAPIIAPPVTSDPERIWRDGFSSTPKPPGTPVQDPRARNLGWTIHFFGTTEGQFDIYYGCIWGTRTAFKVGVIVVAISLAIGLVMGSIAGYYGGVIDELLMRFTDVILAFPGLILAMALVIALPQIWEIDVGFFSLLFISFLFPLAIGLYFKLKTSLFFFLITVISFCLTIVVYTFILKTEAIWLIPIRLTQLDKVLLALALVGWPSYTRVIRGEIMRVKQEDYVEAAKAIGCSDLRIIMRHVLPNSIYPVMIMASLDIGSVVLTAAALSFLGIGAPVGYADWGQMISFARNWIWAGFENPWQYWYTFTIPGLFIFIFVLGWNLLGDAFRDILDPMLRRK